MALIGCQDYWIVSGDVQSNFRSQGKCRNDMVSGMSIHADIGSNRLIDVMNCIDSAKVDIRAGYIFDCYGS